MRYKLFLSLLLSTMFWFSCNISGILDSNDERNQNSDNDYSENILLAVEKTGGFAGVNQKLTVYRNGIASFRNFDHAAGEWTIQLSEAELESLDSLMAANDFYDFSREYIDANVADAFYYSIFYQNDGDSNIVFTDNFASPAGLQDIIAKLEALIQRIQSNGLDFSLEVNKSVFQSGDSVVFKFTFQNVSNQEIQLNFNDGRIYDFSVYQANGTDSDRELIWNWAHNKAFTLALWKMTLQPGESREFEVTWHGKNNDGNFVTGEFEVQATLASNPGGGSGFVSLEVKE